MPNMGIDLEPTSLRIEEQPVKHWMSSVGMGVRRGIGGPQRCFKYKRWSPMKGNKSKVYPRERGIHVFQAPSIV
jgi:hypothetical protein